MFTGLIEKIGKVRRVSYGAARVIEVEAATPWSPPLSDGESIAVNGVCLTVARHDATRFTADVLEETARRSTLGSLAPGACVNLERALRVGDRFGGHVVQGHVDGTGSLISKTPAGRDFRLSFRCPRAIAAATVLKGSIAVNGVSLTVTGLGEDWFSVDIIPTTASETNLGQLVPGSTVNLESDVLGKYALRSSESSSPVPHSPFPVPHSPFPVPHPEPSLTLEKLAESGFL
jgi:riboflavin synthase